MNETVDNAIGGYVEAENLAAARTLSKGELAVLFGRWDGKERRFHTRRSPDSTGWGSGQPRPQSERRVRKDRRV